MWSARGYRIPDSHGEMYQGNTRLDCICEYCHFHTKQCKIKGKWVCRECSKIQKEEQNV